MKVDINAGQKMYIIDEGLSELRLSYNMATLKACIGALSKRSDNVEIQFDMFITGVSRIVSLSFRIRFATVFCRQAGLSTREVGRHNSSMW